MTRSDTFALPAPRPRRRETAAAPCANRPGEALLAAQAQARRGLQAGTGALVHARSAYGEAQWSGEHDRRPEAGLLVRTRL